MKKQAWTILFLAAAHWVQFARAEVLAVSNQAPLLLCRGEQRVLSFPGLLRYSLGSSIVQGRALPPDTSGADSTTSDSVLIRAQSVGSGDLWVWKKDGRIEKRSIRVNLCRSTLAGALESAVSALHEAEIHIQGGVGILRGEINTRQELSRIRAIAGAYSGKIRDESRPSAALLQDEHEEINRWIAQTPQAAVLKSEILGNFVRIRGNVEDAALRRTLEEEIATRFVLGRAELSSLPDLSPTIYFRVFLLEIKKDRFGSIGLSWPGSSPSAFRITTAGIPKLEDLLQLDLTLEALEGEGSLKVLSRPEMAVRAPGEAELFAGGELPIQSKGRYFANVAWKPFGLTLKLKVTHATDTQVRLEIFTEVSQLDGGVSADSIPGIRSNRMKTQVDARFSTPLLLSGLLQERDRESARGVPLLRRIPVLGALFGSADYQQDKSELVAILLPLRAPPEPPSVPKSVTASPARSVKMTERERRLHHVFPYREGRIRPLGSRSLIRAGRRFHR